MQVQPVIIAQMTMNLCAGIRPALDHKRHQPHVRQRIDQRLRGVAGSSGSNAGFAQRVGARVQGIEPRTINRLRIRKRRIRRFGNGQQHRMPVLPGAGVQIKTHGHFGMGNMLLKDLMQRAVRPARRQSAVEQTIGMTVLATLDNRHHGGPAVFGDLFIEQGIGAITFRALQLRAGIDFMQRRIGLIIGQCMLEVQVIAVQVDVVFVDPTQPRSAPRIDQVDHHHRDIGRQRTLAQRLQPLDLTPRTVETFDAMSATQRNQQTLRPRITQHGHIGAQRLTERPFEWMRVLGQRRTGRGRGGQELITLGAVTWLGGELGLHVCLLLIFWPVCCPRPYRKSADS